MKPHFYAILIAAFIITAGCGYKPSSSYTTKVLGTKIFAEVVIPAENPESSVLIADAINEAIVSKFKSRLSSRNEADTIIKVKKAGFSTEGLQTDEEGYTILYRTTSTLAIELQAKEIKKNFSVSGTYDFAVTSESVISEEKRLLSFKFATIKALDEITAKLASMGSVIDDNK